MFSLNLDLTDKARDTKVIKTAFKEKILKTYEVPNELSEANISVSNMRSI